MPTTLAPVAASPHAAGRGPRRRGRRLAGLLFLVALVVALVVPGYAVGKVVLSSSLDDRRATDAIVVLGAAQFDGRPSPVFKNRLRHAAGLYREGVAPRVITVGGKQPQDRTTEADAGQRYLEFEGVPEQRIRALGTGRDTVDSLEAVARLARARGWTSITIVSDPAHVARAGAIAEQLGFTVHLNPTDQGDGTRMTARYVARESLALLVFEGLQRWTMPRLLK